MKEAAKEDTKVIDTFYDKQKSLVDEYKVGKMNKMKLETENSISPKNPAYAIDQLNRYTDYNSQLTYQTSSDCRKTQDQFVYDQKDCTYPNIYKNADSTNFGSKTCVVIS